MKSAMTLAGQRCADDLPAMWGRGSKPCPMDGLEAVCQCVWSLHEVGRRDRLQHGDNPEQAREFPRYPSPATDHHEQLCARGHDLARCEWARDVILRVHGNEALASAITDRVEQEGAAND